MWPIAAAAGGRPSPACQVRLESRRKPYLALLWSSDNGTPGVMPLPRGIAEDSSTATYSTVLHLWVKASLLWPTMVVYVDVTFLVEGDVPMAIYVPDATLSSPCPLHPLLSLSFLGVCLPVPCSPLG